MACNEPTSYAANRFYASRAVDFTHGREPDGWYVVLNGRGWAYFATLGEAVADANARNLAQARANRAGV